VMNNQRLKVVLPTEDTEKAEYCPPFRSGVGAAWAEGALFGSEGLPVQISKKTVSLSPCTRMSKR
jgi:hypothetical protein